MSAETSQKNLCVYRVSVVSFVCPCFDGFGGFRYLARKEKISRREACASAVSSLLKAWPLGALV